MLYSGIFYIGSILYTESIVYKGISQLECTLKLGTLHSGNLYKVKIFYTSAIYLVYIILNSK